jgi:plasminogen activator inhibitor 1 RNA-binding protein
LVYSDSDKKVHQSWGGDDGNTELKVEEAATVDAAAEGAAGNEWGTEAAAAGDAWGAPAAAADDAWALPTTSGDEPAMPTEGDKNEGRRAREREQEEEDNTLTLDQYLAQKAEKEASLLPKLEARKANEGVDDSLWKDVVQVQKGDEEEAYFAAKVCGLFTRLLHSDRS